MKCPESMEDLEALEQLLPLCRTELLEQAQARLSAGTATSERDAARQLAEETGRTEEGIRSSLKRAKKEVGSVNPEGQKWGRGQAGVHNKNMALVERYQRDEHLIQRHREVCEIMGLELPGDLDEVIEKGSWRIRNYITEVMREINRRGTTGRRVAVDSFFMEHKEIRNNHNLCWRCLNRSPRSVKSGLCGGCAQNEAQDRKAALAYAKLRKRGIDEKSIKAWNEVFSEIEVLVNKVDTLLEQESPPKISQEQAQLIIDAGEYLRNQLWKDDLLQIVNLDCYT